MLQLAVTVSDESLRIQRSDGVGIDSACGTGQAAMSASELLAASLGSCVAASLLPMLKRHSIDSAALHVRVSARSDEILGGLDISITLPACDEDMRKRCRRAAEMCPVKQALNVPVEFHWLTE